MGTATAAASQDNVAAGETPDRSVKAIRAWVKEQEHLHPDEVKRNLFVRWPAAEVIQNFKSLLAVIDGKAK